jgi:hypothetical protein
MSVPASEPPVAAAPYRSVGSDRRLAPPPRRVPGRLRTLLYLGGHVAPLGWFFVMVGSILLWSIGANADWSALTVHGPYDHYQGEVLRSHVSVSGDHHHQKSVEVTFRYLVDDTLQMGTSYGDGDRPREGEQVTIEVPRGHPGDAVVVGMRRRRVPFFVIPLLLVFPLVGLGIAGHRMRSGRREVRLLAEGRLAHGKLVHREVTRVRVNDRDVQKLSFDFEDERGRVHRAVVRTHYPAKLLDDALEPLVYDPLSPARVALLDALPGTPRLDASGQLVFDGSPWTLLAAVALPALAVLVNLVAPLIVSALL